MRYFRPLLFGAACCISFLPLPAANADDRFLIAENDKPAWAAEATMNPDYKKDEESPAGATPSDEPAPPATGGQGTTSFFGDNASPANPAWAAEATMNPEYNKDEAPVAAATEEPPPPPTGGQATTSFFGDIQTPANPAWAGEATMNPDYKKEEAPAAAAAEEPPPPPTGGQATTSFFGDSQTPANPAWAAEARMNPDYNASSPATPSATTTQPAAAAVRDAAVEACRDALNAAASAGRIYFTNGSHDLAPGSHAPLKKIAKVAKDCGAVVIEVDGHTDNTGSPAGNKTLSELRAKAVVEFLTAEGVDAATLKAVGLGQERPITTNGTAEGRRLNRRIEFLVSSR